jgi:hypothetical protein
MSVISEEFLCNFHWPADGETPAPCSYWVLFLSKYPARKLMGSGGLKKLNFNSIYLCAKLNSPEANYKVSTGKKIRRVRRNK